MSAPMRADKIETLILRTLFTKKDARVEQKSSECSVEELMVSLLCSKVVTTDNVIITDNVIAADNVITLSPIV